MSRPATLAEVARRTLDQSQDFNSAMREFLDSFYMADKQDRSAMLAQQPDRLPDVREQAFLGAVAEHLARRWGCAIPAWSNDPDRFLTQPYFTTPIEDLKAMHLVQSPLAFRRRMIFTEAVPLRRARMPLEEEGSDGNSAHKTTAPTA